MKNIKLDDFSEAVLSAMEKYYPFKYKELANAFILLNGSFDAVFSAMNYACSEAVSLEDAALFIDKRPKQADAFKEACLPLIKYLCENHHPHVTVIVTPVGAELLEGIKTTGQILDFVKD